jgi:hypothetical protein
VPLALAVLLECIRDGDGPVTQVLAIHGLDGSVGGLEAGVVNEGEALGVSSFRVYLYLGRRQYNTECGESVVQQFFVNLRVQVSNKDVCPHIEIFLMSRGFVDPDRFSKQFDHVHNFD